MEAPLELENDIESVDGKVRPQNIHESNTYSINLSNVISGVNHEVSPWIGGAVNILSRLLKNVKNDTADKKMIESKIEDTLQALTQSVEILGTLSKNIKQLKSHTSVNESLLGSINAWTRVTLLDRKVKEMINGDQIKVYSNSLNFNVEHSPLHLSQIIYNLTKNAIEHNIDGIDDLKISIYGNEYKKELIFEDNGKGISPDVLENIFNLGFTTKDSGTHINGLGLSSCIEYCILMNANISCESKRGLTRFIIGFEKDNKGNVTSERFATKTLK